MKLTTLKMPPELIARLKAESDRTGAPKSEIIRRAIDEYLDRRPADETTTRPRKAGRTTITR